MSSIMRWRNGPTVGWEEVMMRLLLKNEADCLIRQHKPRDRPLFDLQRRSAALYRASGFVHRPFVEVRP
ncbi:hypothetical protein ACFFYR_11365 [Paraburkholderia dipogonis]|uniref:hypothetical protein n=1 Tax=Paraburkholderia dipogonis TaxID=1211383 RepID=UPI00141B1F44|nr:hypothetical protein [Paraburkholderia dipogonis]